ncbi:50S ribosomal protein L11 methyltransferase [Methylosinus sporium]|uniref:50S ribosomal protein L11 methyltransferase n=1 Tax=Methylosinus sporium TaxID=428 RepID=UPI0013305186|nr:50S ribosomal protein L11 methyltransferase [Methylosinus sporium]
MMNDEARNRSIFEAISALDLAGKIVFEIGTGAGLTAMYFARCGAFHVYTCENDEQLYAIAVRNIAQNGLSDRITVVNALSTEYIRSSAFNFSPDVVFTETLDCGVLGEGFASVARDIASIARHDTIVLPSRVDQYGFLVSSGEIAALNSVIPCDEFDLSAINNFSTYSYYPVRYQMYVAQTLSEVHQLRTYSYRDPIPNLATFSLRAYRSGLCHGVVSYFQALFGKSIVTNDVRDVGHWHQAFHPFRVPIITSPGESYELKMYSDGSISLLYE